MAVLAPDASFTDFTAYITRVRGCLATEELEELWQWRQKLLGVRFDTGRGYLSQLPPDEQHLTNKEREAKVFADAKSQGRNIEKLPERNPYWI